MTTIIYLHGFASVGSGAKSDALIAAFGQNNVYAPDLPVDPIKTKEIVNDIVRKSINYPLIFIGTSLGGFWADYFAHKFDAACILVNPAMNPGKLMAEKVGQIFTNFKTGEEITVTQEQVAEFDRCRNEAINLANGYLVHVFLAEDDDVIDYQDTLAQIRYHRSLIITKNGGHRYTEHWDKVVAKALDLANEK